MKYASQIAAPVLFLAVVGLGALFIPYTGIQFDEVLFVEALLPDGWVEHAMKFDEFRVPIMLISYMGTVKAGLYALLLRVFEPNVWTLRIPPLLFCAASVVLFYLTLRRLAGWKAALAAAVLLSSDPIYLLTSVFDWGPVAIQHLLFSVALYAGVRFAQEGGRKWLVLVAFSCGLALWDKAIFVWLLAGGSVALLVVFPREMLGLAKQRRVVLLALGGFFLGALPFLYYNKIHPLRTFTAGVEEDTGSRLNKVRMLDKTMDGGGLFGYMVRHSPEGYPQGLKYAEKIPLFLSGKLRAPNISWQHLLLTMTLFCAPVLWFTPWRRPALFALLTFVVAWLLMIYSRATGGGAHHTVLLWPLPHWLLTFALAAVAREAPRRGFPVAVAAVLVCAGSNLAVLNQYMAQLISSGPSTIWTDAIFNLQKSVEAHPDRKFASVDWGIANPLRFLSLGRLRFTGRSDGLILEFDQPRRDETLTALLDDPAVVFLMRTEGHEVFGGTRERFLGFAREHGYSGRAIETVRDRHGSPLFELWEFRR